VELLRIFAAIGVAAVVLFGVFLGIFLFHFARGIRQFFMRLDSYEAQGLNGWTTGIEQFGRNVGLSLSAPSDLASMLPLECEVVDKYGDPRTKTQEITASAGYGNPARTAYTFAYPEEFGAPVDEGTFKVRWFALPERSPLAAGWFVTVLDQVPYTRGAPPG